MATGTGAPDHRLWQPQEMKGLVGHGPGTQWVTLRGLQRPRATPRFGSGAHNQKLRAENIAWPIWLKSHILHVGNFRVRECRAWGKSKR